MFFGMAKVRESCQNRDFEEEKFDLFMWQDHWTKPICLKLVIIFLNGLFRHWNSVIYDFFRQKPILITRIGSLLKQGATKIFSLRNWPYT